MGLEIAQEEQDTLRILILRGRLDADTAADLELAVQDLLTSGARDFLIDLEGVSYVSSAGLRVMLALAKQLEGSKGRLRLCAIGPAVMQVFDVAGFSKLFVIVKDRAAATQGPGKQSALAAPSVAQLAARILRSTLATPPRSAQAEPLARAAAQILGVRQAGVGSAAKTAAVPVAISVDRPKPGVLGKLRGVFGGKKA